MLTAVWLTAAPGPAAAQNDNGRLDVSRFYLAPALDAVPGFVRQSEAAGSFKKRNYRPPAIGFLAGVFTKYPDRLDWTEDEFEFATQTAIATALMLSGQVDQAVRMAEKGDWPDKVRAQLAAYPTSLMDMPIQTPTDLDILWGASFATGDPAYPRRIVRFFAGIADSGAYSIDELILVSHFKKESSSNEYLVRLKDKYGRKDFIRLVVGATALWALGSNSKQHDFVNDVVEAEIAAAPASDSAYAMRRVLFRNRNQPITDGAGKGIKLMLSATDDGPEVIRKAKTQPASVWMETLRDEFSRNERVDVVTILFLEPSAAGRTLVTVVSPSGKDVQFNGRIEANPLGEQRLSIGSNTLPPTFLQEEGIYTVRAEFPDGPDGTFVVTNRFFVGR